MELNKNFKILKNAKVIIDLCCAPGSWIQVLKRKLSEEEGLSIIAVDLVDIDLHDDCIKFIRGDITKETIISQLQKELPRAADLVIADCSPKLIGAKDTDHARQIYLAQSSLNIANHCLRVGGNFLTKVFQGDMLDEFKEDILKFFHSYRIYKPKASPKKSREDYLLAFGLKARQMIKENNEN